MLPISSTFPKTVFRNTREGSLPARHRQASYGFEPAENDNGSEDLPSSD
jgi:hypothetical protein